MVCKHKTKDRKKNTFCWIMDRRVSAFTCQIGLDDKFYRRSEKPEAVPTDIPTIERVRFQKYDDSKIYETRGNKFVYLILEEVSNKPKINTKIDEQILNFRISTEVGSKCRIMRLLKCAENSPSLPQVQENKDCSLIIKPSRYGWRWGVDLMVIRIFSKSPSLATLYLLGYLHHDVSQVTN